MAYRKDTARFDDIALTLGKCTSSSFLIMHGLEMATTAPKLQVLRSLIKELRNSLQGHERVRHSPAFTYIMDNYRRNAVTDQQYCREQEEMAHLAHTCATYLKSNRKYQELHAEYHGRGERTVKETADLVGFKLPHDPR
ncbi:protein FMC1 homolog isoform X2 [Penaeus monodon]|uniref:protein FMC1 homolog isoform X2 n=1 Tax=Penaeus monodon TaxID=6687 RepID=UPI0018A7CC20|nr:protein FMC1 homolog isoform X2 [Penaeus monodon]